MISVMIVLSFALLSVVNSQGLIPGVSNQCFEPAAPGQCRAFIPQFYFNRETGICDCFIFGGCQGNNNRFARLDQCMTTCNVNPARQVISQACIRIFGADNSNFVQSPRPITQAPVVNPLPIIATFPTAPGKATQQPDTPATAAPSAAGPVTTAQATASPAISTTFIASSPIVTSSSTIIQQSKVIVSQSSQGGVVSKGVVGVIFTKNGITGQITIHIGQPIFFSQITEKTNDDDDDK